MEINGNNVFKLSNRKLSVDVPVGFERHPPDGMSGCEEEVFAREIGADSAVGLELDSGRTSADVPGL